MYTYEHITTCTKYDYQEEYSDLSLLKKDMDAGYQQNALNCWIAALLYLVTLCVSVQQFWMNNRSTYRSIQAGLTPLTSSAF